MSELCTAAMIGDLEPPSILLSEYEKADSPFFIPGIDYISRNYNHMRRVRGDGNCFYRAFIFSYLEGLLRDYNLDSEKKKSAEKERDRITKIIDDSKLELVTKHSYSEIAIESFQEVDDLLLKKWFFAVDNSSVHIHDVPLILSFISCQNRCCLSFWKGYSLIHLILFLLFSKRTGHQTIIHGISA